jgi:ADP-ribosyl-[dinitrogen reductase] hydrolase
MLMNQNNAIGMFMGLFIGDALGAPLEFIPTADVPYTTDMVGGGVHNTAPGEWTDDGAMAMCIADAYIKHKQIEPSIIMQNFKQWKNRGTFGTRDYCFDIGNTTAQALSESSNNRPYGGSANAMASGNGSIMRTAPTIIANHNNLGKCIGHSVAAALLTHGSPSTIDYMSAFAHEMYVGKMLPEYAMLRQWTTTRPDNGGGSIMYAYNTAWKYATRNGNFEDALVSVVNLGHDADTVGAVTGMIAGRLYGYDAIPQRWLDALVDHDKLLATATMLYNMGDV